MNDKHLCDIELLLAADRPADPPPTFRDDVLTAVKRECRAARWDRRLKSTATVLLLAGVGLNLIAWQERLSFGYRPGSAQVASRDTRQLTERLADITDTETAQRYVVQLAALQGWPSEVSQ